MTHTKPLVGALAALALWVPAAFAQEGPPEAAAGKEALAACVAAAEAGTADAATQAADRAEAAFTAWAQAEPANPEPLNGRAQVISRCRIPFAPFMEQGVLVGRSNQLAEKALALDPTHWSARYLLALNHYYTPEFLGRTPDAIENFEILIEQQGDRTDFPEMAGPFAYLGDLYERVGRHEDAVAIWNRGAALFPDDARLRERLATAGAAAGPTSDATGAARDGAGAAQAAPTAGAQAAEDRAVAIADGDTVAAAPIVVTVEGGWSMDDTRPQASLRKIDVYTAPGGTADILQVFQMLPGVTRASEGSDLYVRGGDPAESPVLLEGARLAYAGVFETLHGGVFGILDPSVLKKAYFSSGGFSARYGDALSGVVELETDGRPGVASWRAGWNFAGAGATLRRPLGPRAGAWGSVRATDISLLLALHGDKDEYESVPRSVEGVAGTEWSPRPGLELKAIGLALADHSAREVDAIGWTGSFESAGRTMVGLASARVLSEDATRALHASAFWTRRSSDLSFGVLDRERADRALGLRAEGEWAPSESRAVRLGVEGRRLSATEAGHVPTTERMDPAAPSEPLDGVDRDTWHAGAWIESEVHPLAPLALVAGARADRLPGESGVTVDPRAAVAYRAGEWTLRAGTGAFQQGRWRSRFELPDNGAPAGIPRRARHYTLGVERQGEPWVKVESYWKRYDRYIVPDDAAETAPAVLAGRAAGLDAIVRWTGTERWDGWVSYSLLHGRSELEDGRTVSSDYDVTHSVTAVGQVYWGAWRLGVTNRFATGRPYTEILGSTAPAGGGPREPLYGAPNGARLPAYYRLDARLTRFFPFRNGYVVAYVEMLNLTDRANASAVVYDANWENPRTVDSIFADRTFVAGFEFQP